MFRKLIITIIAFFLLTYNVNAGSSGDLVLFEAIGGGLAWGSGLVKIGQPV